MKHLILAAALAAAFPAFADTTVGSTNDNSAGAINSGVTLSNTYQTSPYNFSNGILAQRLDTNQAHSAASSFATSAVWGCATSGWGVGAQAVGGGLTIAGKGGESIKCAINYTLVINKGIDAMPEGESKQVAIRIACKDEDLADAWEGTSKQCPDMRNAKSLREQRWDRERQIKQTLGDEVVPVASRPNPWQAGG